MTDPAPDGLAGRRRLLVASTTALVLAATVTVTLHELAHAVAGLASGWYRPCTATSSRTRRSRPTRRPW